jgi:hypothetical protein
MPIVIFVAFRIHSIISVIFDHHEKKLEQGKDRKDVERPKSLREAELNSKWEITPDKLTKKICNVYF